ncbi:transcriptional regulator [Enemella dayhoffiae]|uniref:Transcriptional regulator n=1 Tax=Enemella dayhoffiae TaxID=2016507 RepID=A0A255H0X0_9ACTN|nr:helix-turn-helix transcriptional regulator [Enemella dayhoffiae]OYO20853.1 transcriptional regulator [Enemella dayhoffiae]
MSGQPNRVREFRELAGLSQCECAARLGATRQTVISVEKGHFDPRLSLAIRIAELFGRSLDEIFRAGQDAGPGGARWHNGPS